MRAKLAEKQMQDKLSLTDAVKACRAQCADNVIDLNGMAPAEGIARNNEKQRSERLAKHPRTELARVEKDQRGKKICTFYNEGRCTYRSGCRFSRACNVCGCGGSHMASEHHRQ